VSGPRPGRQAASGRRNLRTARVPWRAARLWTACGLAWLCTAAAAAAAPVQVHLSLEPAVIGLDETATLTIEAAGGGIGSLRFQPRFSLENLEAAGGASQFEDLNLVNGNLSRSFRWSLQLRPIAVGPARVRSILIEVRGQLVRLPDQEIRVQEQPAGLPGAGTGGTGGAGTGPGGAGRGRQPREPADLFERFFGEGSPLGGGPAERGPAAFLRAEVQPERPLVGEQALYTIYLYTRENVTAINATAMPSFRGFWVRDLPQPERLTAEMVPVGGDRYGRVAMIRKALFGLRPGRHLLEPAACDVVTEPPGGGFFGSVLGRSEELHLRTPELAVEVQPLPSAPPGFGGLVGQVSLAATLQPYNLHLGEGATLAVTLAGAGNLQGVTAPRLELPPGMTVFGPQQQSEDHLSGTTVAGRRTWTYVVVPTRPGRFAVRPRSIAYFDPAHREYRLAESPALPLSVLPPPAATPTGTDAAALHPIRSAALHDQAPPAWASWPRRWPALLAWLALPWGVVAAVLLARRRGLPARGGAAAASARAGRAAPSGGPAGSGGATHGGGPAASGGAPASPRWAGGAAATPGAPAAAANASPLPVPPAELERKLREAAREDRPRQAAALVEEGWRGYLGRKWGLPATTPPARWSAALAAHGLAPELAAEMAGLAEGLHYLRYAPQLSATGAVRDELLARSRRLLRRLR
jgi:BatD DUF11 like domain